MDGTNADFICSLFSDNTVQTVDIGKFFDKRSGRAERIRFAIENGNIVWGKN
jgi:hypothetical protein